MTKAQYLEDFAKLGLEPNSKVIAPAGFFYTNSPQQTLLFPDYEEALEIAKSCGYTDTSSYCWFYSDSSSPGSPNKRNTLNDPEKSYIDGYQFSHILDRKRMYPFLEITPPDLRTPSQRQYSRLAKILTS